MLCLLAAFVVGKTPPAWYGPVTVVAPISVIGNPYDPDENDVTVDFTAEDGQKLHRLAYFTGDGKFAATLVSPFPGRFTAEFTLNGRRAFTVSPVDVQRPLPHGFIGLKGRHFEWTDGTPYFPIGYDYGWKSLPNESVAQGMTKLGREGGNWSRIWASHWDDKNPFWPRAKERIPGRLLRQEPLQTWDEIVQAAEHAGVSFQFVLFHHGPYSTTTDSNWRDHPWNTANGGFLKDPTDFFVDPEAKRRTKIWLRYAVARYAHSPSIMAWELFNEVQWVDAAKKNPKRVDDVAAWHREMAAYVRSLDPYHHLVTSSSSETLDSGVFDAMDYMQPHTYPANVLASIGGYDFKKKPGFFGEFGPPGYARPGASAAPYRKLVRDGIYAGILAGHAGAGEFWFWDQIDRAGLGPNYAAARKVIDESGLLEHEDAKPTAVWVDTPGKADLTLAAGGGWSKSTLTELDLPRVDIRSLGGWSQYFQSMNGRQKSWAKPLVVKFRSTEPGRMQLNVGQVSTSGGALTVYVNNRKVLEQNFEQSDLARGGSPSRGSRQPVLVGFPAGRVTVRIENHGEDWVQLNSIVVPGIGATAYGHGMEDRNWALVRIFGTDTSEVTVSGLRLGDGTYSATAFDAETGETSQRTIQLHRGRFTTQSLAPDSVLAISR
ncbi:MAG: cellulase family glycosylhydrolase [Fimbriimonas sp.]|nr:cellulase family glycosylhydrolase [Fimbriimonas sp.]